MKGLKIVVPLLAILAGSALTYGVVATAPEPETTESIDTRPVVTVDNLNAEDYTVTLQSYGEVAPLETTRLAAQVTGEVTGWHPSFVTGGLVRRGDVLFSIERDAYEAALLQAEAQLSAAQAQLIQEQAQADVAAKEARTLPDSQVSDLYLRKPQLLSAAAAVKSAEAMLKIAQRDLKNCDVVAPYDALVVSREVGVGEYITTGTLAATLHNVETAEVTFPVAGFDRALLPPSLAGHPVEISSAATPDASFTAQIHREAGLVDAATRMTHLVLRIDDPYGLRNGQPRVKFGAYVNVSFSGKTLTGVYRVPQSLITKNQIWLLAEDGTLFSRPVDVVHESGKDFLIRGELSNASVVLTLPEYPQPGMAVKVADQDDNLVARQPQ